MDLLKKYFPDLTSDQFKKFELLGEGLTDWNQKINVISRKDMEHLSERHILHSLAIAKFIGFTSGSKIIDVGTGGGFPGLPLAIVFPDCKFTLVDSIGKKIRVVNELVELTGIKNVSTKHQRSESVNETFDFVVSRAVTAFPAFYLMTKKLVRRESRNAIKNGIISLKGGDLTEELKSYKRRVTVEPVKKWFEESFFETKSVVYMPV